MSITVRDGLVIQQWAPGNRPEVVWADCERCGTQPPIVQDDGYHTWIAGPSGRPFRRAYCSLCEGEAPTRYVTWKESKRKHVRCDKRCLDGQNECNCGCQGRCHGLGFCQCKKGE